MKAMRILLPGLLGGLLIICGCATRKTVVINSVPGDALIKVNGFDRGRAPVTEKFVFEKPTDTFYVTAIRKGFQDKTATITRDGVGDSITLEMKPHVRRISLVTSPVPAIITVDGRPLNAEPVSAISTDVEFTVDASDNWITHTITAERKGFIKAEQQVTWGDNQTLYNLKLDPMRKDIHITTTPPGAKVTLNGEDLGVTPLTQRQRAFDFDTTNNTWNELPLVVSLPGYDPIESKISWDNGQTDYNIDLVPKSKTIHLKTDPADADVSIDGAAVRRENGEAVADLVFTPINAQGQLRTYKVHATKKTADAAWYPADMVIAWDNGKPDYTLKLREILSQSSNGTALNLIRKDGDWVMRADPIKTISMKFVTEPQGDQPQKIIDLPKDQTIGSLSVSPDGQYLVYTVVGGQGMEPQSQMYRVRTDGTGGATTLSDGRSLDVTPSYTAAGDKIVFSSNRAGKKLSVWAINAAGEGGVTRYTTGDTNDLYPGVDASAKPRLFYEAHIDTRPDPRLYVAQVGTSLQTDLTQLGGLEPRVSPRNDSVVYVLPNEKTGKRDLYRVSDRGGSAELLTDASDNTDPSWNSNGTQIAFASDRGKDSEDNRNNFDIWVMDLANPAQPKQITRNGSVDDMPVFDPSGETIYFRSNRGGAWGIWKISVKP
ncbi:MAG: PEGA domain-containing protein [Tepidisphaeraceae bacterium]